MSSSACFSSKHLPFFSADRLPIYVYHLLGQVHLGIAQTKPDETCSIARNRTIRAFEHAIHPPNSMAPPPLSTTSASRRFSSSFITGAISTAASPLQASFNLTCRSPIRPSYGAEARRSTDTGGASAKQGNDYTPESTSSLLNVRASTSTEGWDRRDIPYDEDAKSISSEDSPTDETWFLQPESPGLHHGGYGGFGREEGKLGVMSAINIIVGKTIGVGAYTIPSIIFAGVGSVGMTLLLWVIGSLISFCGLAVYLVSIIYVPVFFLPTRVRLHYVTGPRYGHPSERG